MTSQVDLFPKSQDQYAILLYGWIWQVGEEAMDQVKINEKILKLACENANKLYNQRTVRSKVIGNWSVSKLTRLLKLLKKPDQADTCLLQYNTKDQKYFTT